MNKLVLLACLSLTACHPSQKVDAGHKLTLTFPCIQGQQRLDSGYVPDGGDAMVDSSSKPSSRDSGYPADGQFDPNNCGRCGTLCGTYVNKGAGYSLSQGTCLNNNIGCYDMNQPSPAVYATTTTDCYDNYGGGWVVNTLDGAPGWQSGDSGILGGHGLCVNIMQDPNNCGKLGYSCSKFGSQGCNYGQCQ